jgi:parallel beta-helix repeat protein
MVLKRWFALFITVLALGCAYSAPVSRVLVAPGSPTIRISADQRKVSIQYERGSWSFRRPVVSPWAYAPAGTVFWVDPAGDDAADGSADRPFRSLAKGLAAATPGDLVCARPGTYVENLLITKSGLSDKPIILSCAPGALGKVKITPSAEYVTSNPHGAVITVSGAQYIWINGLIIEGPRGRPEAPTSETYGANGITWANGAGLGCRATNNVVYYNVHCGLKEMGHGGTQITMEGNVIFENGTSSTDHGIYCPADAVTINGNILFNHPGYGIHSYSSPRGQRITRNLCLGNKAGGILLAGSETQVYHNVCSGNGVGILYFRSNCLYNVVENNIFAFNGVDGGYDDCGGKVPGPANNVDDYNCYYPGAPPAAILPGGHEVRADPLFQDRASGDYQLKLGSPCQDRGLNLGEPFLGPAPDLGAFESALYDVTPPTIRISSPTAGVTVSGTLYVTVSTGDNVRVVKVELYVDGNLVNSTTQAPFTTQWSTRRAKSGSHLLRCRAYDAAGNFGDSPLDTVYK